MIAIELARAAGVTPDSLRHYIRICPTNAARHPSNGYRRFGSDELARLHFIQSARQPGFLLEATGQIISMADHGDTPCPLLSEFVGRRIVETRRRRAKMSAPMRSGPRCPTVKRTGMRHAS